MHQTPEFNAAEIYLLAAAEFDLFLESLMLRAL